RWLFLTDQVRSYSAQWQVLHARMVQLNMAFANDPELRKKVTAVPLKGNEQKLTLLRKLDGFAWIPPVEDSALSTTLAAVPLPANKVSERAPHPNGRLAQAGSAGSATLVK